MGLVLCCLGAHEDLGETLSVSLVRILDLRVDVQVKAIELLDQIRMNTRE